MKRSLVETILGALVIAIAVLFFVFSYNTAEVGAVSGYELTADFTDVGGIRAGDAVQISGVKIGTVSKVALVPERYLARVHMSIDSAHALPDDTAALIGSESLLGGRYVGLKPGGSEDMLEAGDAIEYTQASQNLEQLLGEFIFSMKKDDAPQ